MKGKIFLAKKNRKWFVLEWQTWNKIARVISSNNYTHILASTISKRTAMSLLFKKSNSCVDTSPFTVMKHSFNFGIWPSSLAQWFSTVGLRTGPQNNLDFLSSNRKLLEFMWYSVAKSWPMTCDLRLILQFRLHSLFVLLSECHE